MDAIKQLRKMTKDRAWSRYHLAKASGLSESTIANIFKRNAMPSIPTLDAICKGLGITLSQFFAENEMVEMTPELQELFEGWRFLTPKQKVAVMAMIKAFYDE